MDFTIGQYYENKRKVTEEDVIAFAKVSGDFNPIHIDEEYAKKSRFERRIAHGMLSASFISAIIGTNFPGTGTIYLSQDLKFIRPVFPGDELMIRVEIIEITVKGRAKLSTIVWNSERELVIEGEAIVILPENEDV